MVAETERVHSERRQALMQADPAGAWSKDRKLRRLAKMQRAVENVQSHMQPLREALQEFWIEGGSGAANQVRTQWQGMSRQARVAFLREQTRVPARTRRPADPSDLLLLPDISIQGLTTGDNLLDLCDSRLRNSAFAHTQDRTLFAAWHVKNGKQEVELLMAALEREFYLLDAISCFLGKMVFHGSGAAMLAGLDEHIIAKLQAGVDKIPAANLLTRNWVIDLVDYPLQWGQLFSQLSNAFHHAKKTAKRLRWSHGTPRMVPALIQSSETNYWSPLQQRIEQARAESFHGHGSKHDDARTLDTTSSAQRRRVPLGRSTGVQSGGDEHASSTSGTSPDAAAALFYTVVLGAMVIIMLWFRRRGKPGAAPQDRQSLSSTLQRRRGGGHQQQRQRDNRRRNNANRRQHSPSECAQEQPPLPPPKLSYRGKPDATEPSWWEALADYHAILQEEAPPTFTCSITHEIMRSPWMLVETMNTFEARAIYRWVVLLGKTHDPKTRENITNPALKPHVALQRDIRQWCEDRVAALAKQNEALQPAAARRSVEHSAPRQLHVFVDDSNLVLGAQGKGLSIGKLVARIHGTRQLEQRVVVGSGHKPAHWSRWREAGYKVHADARRGPEVFVDEALMSQIAQAASQKFRQPRVLAVVTGDGNANGGRATFPDHIQTALLHGWSVELYAWRGAVHRTYARFAETYPRQFKIVHLDGFDAFLQEEPAQMEVPAPAAATAPPPTGSPLDPEALAWTPPPGQQPAIPPDRETDTDMPLPGERLYDTSAPPWYPPVHRSQPDLSSEITGTGTGQGAASPRTCLRTLLGDAFREESAGATRKAPEPVKGASWSREHVPR
jgi:hypothetical protein